MLAAGQSVVKHACLLSLRIGHGERRHSVKTQEEYFKTRNTCCWIAVLGGFFGNIVTVFAPPLGRTIVVAALVLSLVGGYNWARGKARSPAFCLWGILAPIGYLGLALLRDRYWDRVTLPGSAESETGGRT
jgi:hypothetical protein